MSAHFWNGILADHAQSQLTAARVSEAVTPDLYHGWVIGRTGVPVVPEAAHPVSQPDTYRGWTITWDYGQYTGTGPNYDASWEGEEDGWRDNGHIVSARTRDDLIAEIDAWFEESAS